MTQNVSGLQQIVNAPYPAIFGCVVKNNATTPNTKLDITAGICRDQSNTFDANLGNYNGVNTSASADVTTTLDTGVVGVNGIDTGILQASKLYYIYVIFDKVYGDTVSTAATIASLTGPSTGPLMPSGYSFYRLCGYAATDSSIHFLPMYNTGTGNDRTCFYDAPQATAITAGNATSYTAVSLANLVPPVDLTPVWIASAFTPDAASRILNLTPYGGTGNAIAVTGQVASVVVTSNSLVTSKLNSTNPSISYKVSNSSAAVALNVAGFQYFL